MDYTALWPQSEFLIYAQCAFGRASTGYEPALAKNTLPEVAVSAPPVHCLQKDLVSSPFLFPINRHYRKRLRRGMANGVGLAFPDKRKPLVYRKCFC